MKSFQLKNTHFCLLGNIYHLTYLIFPTPGYRPTRLPCPGNGMGMVGGKQEITHANVASWGECGYECWGRAECRAWTWTSATRRCVTLAGNPELAVQSGAYSGGHHCSTARLDVVGGDGMVKLIQVVCLLSLHFIYFQIK